MNTQANAMSIVLIAVLIGLAHGAAQSKEKDESIQAFKVKIPGAQLVDLRRRIAATRWPDKETVADQSQGAQLAKVQQLVRYWGHGYDWRKLEAKLNALPQFMTNIDGVITSSNRRTFTPVVYSRTLSHPNESGMCDGQYSSKENRNMELEKVQYMAKAHGAGSFGLLSRFLLMLFAATMPLAPAGVLAHQPDRTAGRNQGVAAITKNQTETAMTQPGTVRSTDTNAIRPFRVRVPQKALDNLRRRIAATQWPEKETVTDSSQGVPLATIQQLARYWATDYDWRRCEAKLNALPQFITEIDKLDIHFIHVRSKHENALPLIVSHGWPGSVIEQLKIIDPLTNPTAYGATASDAFHVVIPSMPGYGFSGKPTSTGWGPERMARAWAELMKRLGYSRYVAQGADWGAFVVDQMGLQAPPGLLAIHTNMPATVPTDIDKALLAGGPTPSGLSTDEQRAYEQLVRTFKQVDYARLMGSRPQTLYGIADSPVGLAAWLLDHNDADGQPAATVAAALNRTKSATGELTRDEILDNITLYWLTNTGVSASRLYWEYKGGFFNTKGVSIPVAVSVFPGEQYQAPRSWTERAYPKLIYYNKLDRGGHFAAWEEPLLFAAELRAAFKSLR